MSDKKPSTNNQVLTFLGSLGAILIFLLIMLVAYLPNRPEPVDAEVDAERREQAEEALAAGNKKITTYGVVDKEAGIVRIPVAEAMEMTVKAYGSSADGESGE
ncbi:MAG: hypothetical protein ACLFVC_01645 [Opitutales bacterium]